MAEVQETTEQVKENKLDSLDELFNSFKKAVASKNPDKVLSVCDSINEIVKPYKAWAKKTNDLLG